MTRPAPLGRDAYRHWTAIPTRWADNDVYGHVNNTVHYQWFDTAVNGWLIEEGLLDVADGHVIGLVVSSACAYAAPISHPALVEVGLAVERLGTSSITYRLGIFAGSHLPAAEGAFTHVYVDRRSRRPVPLDDRWRPALSRIRM